MAGRPLQANQVLKFVFKIIIYKTLLQKEMANKSQTGQLVESNCWLNDNTIVSINQFILLLPVPVPVTLRKRFITSPLPFSKENQGTIWQ